MVNVISLQRICHLYPSVNHRNNIFQLHRYSIIRAQYAGDPLTVLISSSFDNLVDLAFRNLAPPKSAILYALSVQLYRIFYGLTSRCVMFCFYIITNPSTNCLRMCSNSSSNHLVLFSSILT